VSILYADFHSGTITGVTYGGVAMTLVPGSANSFTALNMEAVQYVLVNPPLGTHSVAVTAAYSVGIIGLSESVTGTNGSIREFVSDAEFGNSTPASGGEQLTPQVGDLAIAFIGYNSNTVPTPGGGQTLVVSNAIGTAYGAASSNIPCTSTAAFFYSFTGIGGTGFLCSGLLFEAGIQFTTTRTHPPGLLTSPTQCWAVLIQRADTLSFGMTDATVPFVYEGVTYQVAQGADSSNVHQETGTSVGDLEIRTILNDALDYVTAADVRGTRFNNSWWTLFLIDYMDPGAGGMILAKYRCSRATLTDSGQKFQLLAMGSILNQTTGRTYISSCDVLETFDKRCDPSQTLLALNSFSRTVGAVPAVTSYNFCTDFFGDTNPEFFYNFGNCTWTGGANTGLLSICKSHTTIAPAAWSGVTVYGVGDYSTAGGSTYISLQPGNLNNAPAASPMQWLAVTGNPAVVARIIWRTPPPYPVAVGDVCTLVKGCDHLKATCKSIANAHNVSGTNVENFHGVYLPNPDVSLLVGRSSPQ
jgi:uncharacterized phage protein (TIGR02218 family)